MRSLFERATLQDLAPTLLVVVVLLCAVSGYLWLRQRRARKRTFELTQEADQLRASEAARRRSEERYALAHSAAHDGLWDWDLVARTMFFAPRWKEMLGYGDEDIGRSAQEWLNRVHPEDRGRVDAAIEAHISGASPKLEIEHRVRHRDGTYRWMLVRGIAARDAAGHAYRLVGSQTDITGRKETEDRLMFAASHDALTALPNRVLFRDILGRALKRAKRHRDELVAVLFLDFDRFKLINDSLGHALGDRLLAAAAKRLTGCIRPEDVVARLGGDEFIILLDGIGEAGDAIRVVERIQDALVQPFALGSESVYITASIGIAFGGSGDEDPDDLVRDADIAMYRAKALGRACFEVFDVDMRVTARARMQLEHDLRRALERGEFELHYQPIIALETGAITAFEALVRWRHPERGLLNAAAFIPLAEETGLIVALGQWVLREACTRMQDWRERFPEHTALTVSVNLSAKELLQPRLVAQLQSILTDTALPPAALKLEITESVFLDNAESAITTLLQLQGLGVQLHLDDFGTGYSSLSYLHRFPIASVKIDRYFVSRLGVNRQCLEIVRTIVSLARNLGMDVIAEGAETADQRAQLRALACAYVQGYLYSPPIPAAQAEQLLELALPGWVVADEQSSFASAPTRPAPEMRPERGRR